MGVKTVLDKITSFIMDPSNNNRKSVTQGIAWVTTILLGIGTIGVAHGLSALWRKLRHIDRNETHEKISRLFHDVFSRNNAEHQAVHERTGLLPPRDTKETRVSAPNIPPLQAVAQTVYDKREELWNAAITEANKDTRAAAMIFINKIRNEFKEKGLSLSKVSNDSDALGILFQSSLLRMALVNCARINHLNDLLDKHLLFVANAIYDNRERYVKDATDRAKCSRTHQLAYLISSIERAFQKEGRSLEEIPNNKEAMGVFQKSACLMVVLTLYFKMKGASSQHSKEKAQEEFKDDRVREAVRLGKDNAKGPGLITRLGLNEFVLDEAQLKRGIKRLLLKIHPDKNPDGDPERVNDANQVLDMLKHDVFGIYQQALKEARNQ